MENFSGRPRNEESRKAILAASFQILLERGYEGLSIEAVAKAAGVGKTTIYRWWSGRAALSVDAFFDETMTELSFDETEWADVDFRQQVHQLANLLRSERGQVLAALITGSRTDSELRQAVEEFWVRPRKQWGAARIKRAVAASQCVPEMDVACALELLYTPLYARLFLGLPVHSKAEIERHCDFLFPSIFTPRKN